MTVSATMPDLAMRSLSPSWDYAAWEQLPNDGNRYEVIQGVLYMTTAPSTFHQWIVSRLLRHVGHVLEDQGWGYAFIAPVGLLMPGCDPVQPDFLLVRAEHAGIITERRIRGVPDMITEVQSPGSLEQDSTIKREAYAQAAVPEFWLIRPNTRDVLVYSMPDTLAGEYRQLQHFTEDQELVAATLPLRLAVASLFGGAPDSAV